MAGQHFGAPSGGFAWGPPAGLAGLLAQDKQQVEAGFKALGSVAGGVTAGAIGGFQGAANPEVFGEGTSSTSGAMQGFATNYDKAMNGGGQGGFGALVGGGGGEGGGGGGGMNFKQLQQQGKVADQFWKLMADGQPKLDGEDPKALGVTKEQWDTFGARDKWGVVSNAFRQQQMQSQALAYRKGMEDLAATVAENQAQAAFQNAATSNTFNRSGGAPMRPAFEDLASAAMANPTAPAAAPILRELAQNGGRPNPSIAFQEDPVSGTRFATYGNILSPSGVNPARAGNAVAITGPNGEALGVGLPGRSGVTPLQTGEVKDKDKYARLSKQLNTLVAAQSNVSYNPTAAAAYDSRIQEVARQLQELESGTAEAPKADRKPVKYKLVNGQLQLSE